MKDGFDNELKVGDTIVYATRKSSYLELKKTKIIEISRTNPSYSNSEGTECLICDNPNYEFFNEEKTKWNEKYPGSKMYGTSPKFIRLACPAYIAKVS